MDWPNPDDRAQDAPTTVHSPSPQRTLRGVTTRDGAGEQVADASRNQLIYIDKGTSNEGKSRGLDQPQAGYRGPDSDAGQEIKKIPIGRGTACSAREWLTLEEQVHPE
jgi:hypothetical protein